MVKRTPSGTVFWGTAAALFLFWLLLTWRLHWQHLVVGALCSLAVAAFNRELFLSKKERPLFTLRTAWGFGVYLLRLIIAVFQANWEVAKIVLSRRLDISPCFVKFRTDLCKPLYRVILGNSITLTPGTLTVEIKDDLYVVHALTQTGADEVATWELAKHLHALEETENAS
ncbi:MAG: Na+/H+ antiporter subunit E [Firmicutes bacterium]|nr:Na+/H+ antiporter subunit E [Bacillota bacterium]